MLPACRHMMSFFAGRGGEWDTQQEYFNTKQAVTQMYFL